MSNIPDSIDSNYYDAEYFAIKGGKKFRNADGSKGEWSYANPNAEWHGCGPIVNAWKNIFNLNSSSKVLDVGCGRGTFIGYMRTAGIEAFGFDYSRWAVEHPYAKCHKNWIMLHDATRQFPYGGCPFDLVIVLDLMEHLYIEDIDKVIDEIYRVCKRWVFLQIATAPGGGSGSGIHEKGYILKRGEKIPIELEGMVVAGHVTVQDRQFWINKLIKGREDKWRFRDDMVLQFISKVPTDVIANWVKNTIIILENKLILEAKK